MTEEVITCKHMSYDITHTCAVVQLNEIGSWQLVMKLTVKCKECGMPFTFRAPVGFSTNESTTNPEGNELVIPIDFPSTDVVVDEFDMSPSPPTWIH